MAGTGQRSALAATDDQGVAGLKVCAPPKSAHCNRYGMRSAKNGDEKDGMTITTGVS